MTRRVVLVGFVLLAGLLVNLAYQPDVGTAADLHSAGLTDPIVGTNHAKPLPRIVTVADVLPTSVTGLFVLVSLTPLCRVALGCTVRDGGRHRSVFRSPVRARRGPPAPVTG
jgi:hypothetical protein